eukprot:3681984-Alexandrium_andersonii.AAC.1
MPGALLACGALPAGASRLLWVSLVVPARRVWARAAAICRTHPWARRAGAVGAVGLAPCAPPHSLGRAVLRAFRG